TGFSVGGGALQQWGNSHQEHALRRKLRPRGQLASDQDNPSTDWRRNSCQGSSSGTDSTVPLGNFSTRQRASSMRAGRGEKSRARKSFAQRAARQARRQAKRARTRNRTSH